MTCENAIDVLIMEKVKKIATGVDGSKTFVAKTEVVVLGGNVYADGVLRMGSGFVAFCLGDLPECIGGNVKGHESGDGAVLDMADFFGILTDQVQLIGIETLFQNNSGAFGIVAAIGVEHMQYAKKFISGGKANGVIAVAGNGTPAEDTVLAIFKLGALPIDALGGFVIVVAEGGSPGNFKGIHEGAKPFHGAAAVIEGTVDDVAGDEDQVRLGLSNQGSNVIAALGHEVFGGPGDDLVAAEPVGGTALRCIDDLHIGELQQLNGCVFALGAQLDDKITAAKSGVLVDVGFHGRPPREKPSDRCYERRTV